ncbi:glucose 1-dehydrogenase [Microbulbifer spongiae]|uniref:Glucose 1-dehydrogenase n=1 Tax=Microbulbifer spongiae TaxID=2944933 RepID=A0ABY9ECG0_9GAMM|nr:glucose 1-dehydrogenase [Microbulbifer sp. MI-G]WKD49040.1 glucose 1-dehydrogenase [Microbulbifer sp. MI-G]
MKRLTGKTAIVTGGASGIGEATVRLFVEHGAKVVIADIDEQLGQALAEELGEMTVFQYMDVSIEEDWTAAVTKAQTLGTYNVLVNNAAILHMSSIIDTSPEEYMRIIEVNQLGTFMGIRSAIEPMKAAGIGSIINVSSVDGLHSSAGLGAYSSSKWAVRGLTKSAAIELGQYGIRVNSVHPGGIYTKMGGADRTSEKDMNRTYYAKHPIPRVGQPLEIAYVSLFLATDEASYSTGSEFIADGGWLAGLRDPDMPCS